MRKQFPLFQNHLDLAHGYWNDIIQPGDTVIDATCGNGHDSLALANMCLSNNSGTLYCLDLQDKAVNNTKQLLTENLSKNQMQHIRFFNQCHSQFPQEILPQSVRLIAYNLGYMPGGDKAFTTMLETTKTSLVNALELLLNSGLISITCYPGHPEGKKEEEALLEFTKSLSPKDWSCSHHRWMNRTASPSLVLIQKA